VSASDARLLLWGFLALSLVMLAGWFRQRATRNAGIVDVLWAGGLGGLAILYAALASGWGPRRVLVAVLVGAWSLRLTLHLVARLRSEPEDGRYARMRERLGERFDRTMLWFFQAQALLAVVLSVAFLIPSAADVAGFGLRDGAAVLIFAVALFGEELADRQLRAWRSDAVNRGRTCRTGLWRYSRHPNYFFEWMHWIAYAVLAIGLPLGWLAWSAPALMLFLVLKVTGIPPTEEQALRSRGADYRAYQQTTNAFFPGPPKVRSNDVPQSS
jgi:steroid 5-alpha reductase family enzyme